MNRVFERVVVFLTLFVVVVWGGYHVFRYTQHDYELEAVFQDTVPRSITGTGVAIREETAVVTTGSDTPRFIHKDGIRVGKDQAIVEYYTGAVNEGNIQKLRDIDEEIQLLEIAQNKNLNNYASAPTISRDIREQFALLTEISTTGLSDNLLEVREELELLVNRRQIATGKSDNFSPRIAQLKKERDYLKKEGNLSSVQYGYAEESGYFVKNVDGMERHIRPEAVKEYDIDDYLALIQRADEKAVTKDTGRLVTNSQWFFAVAIPDYQTEGIKPGHKTQVSFEDFPGSYPARVSQVLVENKNDTAVVVLTSDTITDDILNLRVSEATMAFSQFTGLRINSNHIRFRENPDGTTDRGVFVLENYMVKFKKIDPVYEEANFVLSRLNYADSKDKEYVRLFDQIIQGNDLYDGKIIQ